MTGSRKLCRASKTGCEGDWVPDHDLGKWQPGGEALAVKHWTENVEWTDADWHKAYTHLGAFVQARGRLPCEERGRQEASLAMFMTGQRQKLGRPGQLAADRFVLNA